MKEGAFVEMQSSKSSQSEMCWKETNDTGGQLTLANRFCLPNKIFCLVIARASRKATSNRKLVRVINGNPIYMVLQWARCGSSQRVPDGFHSTAIDGTTSREF